MNASHKAARLLEILSPVGANALVDPFDGDIEWRPAHHVNLPTVTVDMRTPDRIVSGDYQLVGIIMYVSGNGRVNQAIIREKPPHTSEEKIIPLDYVLSVTYEKEIDLR